MKRTPIVTSLLLAGLLLTFNACKKGADAVTASTSKSKGVNGVTIENGRLAFTSHKEYYKFIETVKPGTADDAGFHSLYTALNAGYKKKDSDPGLSSTLKDLDQFGFPEGFLATLNEKGEVKIGDEIIWYHDGDKYFIPASEEANLDLVKQNPVGIKKMAFGTSTPNNARPYITVTGLDARNQHEFFPLDANGNGLVGSNRKYVHEIYGRFDPYTDPSLPGIDLHHAYIMLRLKMEWRGCCDWNPNASEPRTETVAVSGSATLPGKSRLSSYLQGPTFTINDTRSNLRENLEYTLVIADIVGGFTNGNNVWDVDMTGTITSYFEGSTNASGQWINTGALW
ncbi:hypothetical protein A3860_30950 [Niastella vici]|uniref:Uncharacterized protein n=1 Tax=Niastella vici TaxID=1703345 RepID=A0A1V9FU48_9BACT|nr:hypothetical protein [Niastella vici]OQP61885.1 hypothetical protein A3860_30950 [Niastella vici]